MNLPARRIEVMRCPGCAKLRGSKRLSADDSSRIEPAAIAALYVEYADELRSFLIGVLRSADLAGEALQATFVKALEVGHTSREETRKGWLFRVAYREAMLIRRKQAVDQKSVRKAAWSTNNETVRPEENISRWEVVDAVRTALKTLPAEQAQVVRMRIYEDKTFAVIADELKLPLGTVLNRMRSAMNKLQQRLHSTETDTKN